VLKLETYDGYCMQLWVSSSKFDNKTFLDLSLGVWTNLIILWHHIFNCLWLVPCISVLWWNKIQLLATKCSTILIAHWSYCMIFFSPNGFKTSFLLVILSWLTLMKVSWGHVSPLDWSHSWWAQHWYQWWNEEESEGTRACIHLFPSNGFVISPNCSCPCRKW